MTTTGSRRRSRRGRASPNPSEDGAVVASYPSPMVALRPILRRTLRHTLVGRARDTGQPEAGRFTRADADRLLEQTWKRFAELAPGRPREPTRGARQNVLLAALTLAAFRALLDAGVERGYAIELIGDAAWRLYAWWGRLDTLATAPFGGDPPERLRRRVNLFLRYPFGRPAYQYADRPQPRGRGLDMLRCPIADYMRGNEAADLCVGTWCNLDFALAEMWGGHLERQGTLAGGAPRCDFRFIASPRPIESLRRDEHVGR